MLLIISKFISIIDFYPHLLDTTDKCIEYALAVADDIDEYDTKRCTKGLMTRKQANDIVNFCNKWYNNLCLSILYLQLRFSFLMSHIFVDFLDQTNNHILLNLPYIDKRMNYDNS